MAYEDWTSVDWTEFDENGDFTVAANTITITSIRRDASAGMIRDWGAGYWGAFDKHDIDLTVDIANTDNLGILVAYIQSQDVTHRDIYEIYNNDDGWYVQGIRRDTENVWRITIGEYITDHSDFGDRPKTSHTDYLRISRDATNIYCKIYSDAARTVLVDTILCGLSSAETFRCIIAPASYDQATSTVEAQGSAANLDLWLAVSTGSNWYAHDGGDNIEFERDDDSPLKMYDGSETVGIALVTTDDGAASAFRIYDGASVKALKKKT